jgi:hypothetical protein
VKRFSLKALILKQPKKKILLKVMRLLPKERKIQKEMTILPKERIILK